MDAVVLGGQDGEVGDAMDVDPPEQSNGVGQTINKNAHLKGRKRFNADLADMKDACKGIFQVDGLRVKSEVFCLEIPSLFARNRMRDFLNIFCVLTMISDLRPGDDEGSFEFKILTQELDHIVAVNLLVSGMPNSIQSHPFSRINSNIIPF